MSDASYRDPLGPFNAAIRSHLGEFADLWMLARIRLLRKLEERIVQTTDPEELGKLRKELNDAILSEEDLDSVAAKVKKLHDIVREINEIKQTVLHDKEHNRH